MATSHFRGEQFLNNGIDFTRSSADREAWDVGLLRTAFNAEAADLWSAGYAVC